MSSHTSLSELGISETTCGRLARHAGHRSLHIPQAHRADLAMDLRQDMRGLQTLQHIVEHLVNRDRFGHALPHQAVDFAAVAIHREARRGTRRQRAHLRPDNRIRASGPPATASAPNACTISVALEIMETMRGITQSPWQLAPSPRRRSHPRRATRPRPPVWDAGTWDRRKRRCGTRRSHRRGRLAGGRSASRRQVELAAGEACAVQRLFIHAGDSGAQSAADHLPRQFARGNLPEGNRRFQPAAGQLALAILADIAQEQIAERDGFESLRHRRPASLGHAGLRTLRWSRAMEVRPRAKADPPPRPAPPPTYGARHAWPRDRRLD